MLSRSFQGIVVPQKSLYFIAQGVNMCQMIVKICFLYFQVLIGVCNRKKTFFERVLHGVGVQGCSCVVKSDIIFPLFMHGVKGVFHVVAHSLRFS